MRPKIYLFGDSITEESFGDGGWGASLSHHFCRTVDVVLRGYSGYNTRWAVKVAERIFPPVESGGAPPLAFTVFFGANDACLPDRYSAFQHVPLHEYKQNLHSIISFFKKRWPEIVILLITPPPIDEDARLRYDSNTLALYIFVPFFLNTSYGHPYIENPSGLPERTNEAAGAYAQACISVAKECGCPVVDLWIKMQECPDWKQAYLSDGLHLTQAGNRIVFEEVVKELKEKGISVENLPVDLPHIANIDPQDPLKAFQDC
ncbi:hypothetical protein NC653_027388 [Populus alba x Populus x berolinensis]|uniref:SGNH hydrolase-type esterase domain-containing protein n=1 Tax=Populus alba x Populus x berolinensis TaxID=444605 RepID=A0AAD6M5U7_9ROSI|nr:hypothetical protein NC653_027388 [Populus alba x Populus x berolinensis]